MVKLCRIFLFALILLIFGSAVNAEELNQITVEEIGSNYVMGSYGGEGKIMVYRGGTLLGQGESESGKFKINLSQLLTANSQLTLKAEGTDLEESVIYQPAVMNEVDDKEKVISGKTAPGATVTAVSKGKSIPLQSLNKTDGSFVFKSSSLLKYNAVAEIVTTVNDIRSVATIQVKAAPAPAKPKVDAVSNKNRTITGYAEPNSIVYISNGTSKYKVRASAQGAFKKTLARSKKLAPKSYVSVYAKASRHNATSQVTKVRVTDKIAPSLPKVNKITNKSLTISGTAEPKSRVYILRNSKKYKNVKVDSKGNFKISIPLQPAKTKFEFYAKDTWGNKGSKRKVSVYHQSRPAKKLMYTPVVRQMPELPRGCEVTSLAMMLNHAGVPANKMTLAKQVKKDPTIYRYSNGKKYFGNPNYGFVGDMYSFSKPGFGVFNKPIEELANTYMPGRIVNLSGQSFDSVLNYVAAGKPVWVINTSWFSYVPSQYWQTWYTPQGPIRITMKEHSVLVTGYDSKYVYFNDPLDGQKNKKRLKKHFVEGWTQYGKQAISYY